jgi:hypothetical protein
MTDKTRGIHLVSLLGFLTVSATAGGCGGGGGGNDELTQFTGTWTYTQSMVTFACPNQPDQGGTYGTTKLWNVGVTSDLVDMTPSFLDGVTTCYYTFDVKNKVATIKPAQSCPFFDITGAEFDEAPTSWTFTLTSATTADEMFVSSFQDPCTLTGVANLKKVAEAN